MYNKRITILRKDGRKFDLSTGECAPEAEWSSWREAKATELTEGIPSIIDGIRTANFSMPDKQYRHQPARMSFPDRLPVRDNGG